MIHATFVRSSNELVLGRPGRDLVRELDNQVAILAAGQLRLGSNSCGVDERTTTGERVLNVQGKPQSDLDPLPAFGSSKDEGIVTEITRRERGGVGIGGLDSIGWQRSKPLGGAVRDGNEHRCRRLEVLHKGESFVCVNDTARVVVPKVDVIIDDGGPKARSPSTVRAR